MQLIENRTQLTGLLQHIKPDSDIAGFGEVTLIVHHTAPLPGITDLLSARSPKTVCIYVPDAELTNPLLKLDETVTLVVRLASRDHFFAQPDTLRLAE
ncbi:hypothetical protein [Fibrella aquatilis]|uniref:Uncharacterized protein n=1 Tax=Fibrella aquatilis TaxID=2817059 RepID=A0A939GBC2_9BACT|nr:hypothetical protein [Fibrella aquatilis]MBO0933258.1 hypothetical protein [Fibrella aquatilis]